MSNETKILGIIGVVTVALIIGAVLFLSKPEKPVLVDTSKLVRENSLKTSSGSAKLTIVEFGDYQCPACGMAHPAIKQAIADSSPQDINFVFRHFPLAQHQNAEIAAQAVEAANLQGKVWEMHDKLYDGQPEWENESSPVEVFKKYALEIGIDVDKFEQDINNDEIKQKVKDDLADGLALNVNATPTFYFNGELYRGGISYDSFKSAIEARLK